MQYRTTRTTIMTLGLLLTAHAACAAADSTPRQDADEPSRLSGWTLGVAPYNHHYNEPRQENPWEPANEKHAYVWLIQAEKQLNERNIAGFAIFNNSFGQFSQYAYYGWKFQPWDAHPELFLKLTGGVIHGYRYPYHKKIPLNNRHGWGLTVIPAVGYQFTPNWGAQLNVLGNAALMFQINYTFK